MFGNRSGEMTSSGRCRSGQVLRTVLAATLAFTIAGCSETGGADEEKSMARVEQAASAATSCGYSVSTGTYSKWPSGYQAWVELGNVSGATGTTFELLLDVGTTTISNGYQASFVAADGGYRVTAPDYLKWQTIPVGNRYRFGFVGSGNYQSVTPYVVSINGVPCDTTPPTIDLTVNSRLFTADGTLTLSAAVSDDVAVRKVIFRQDDVVIGEDRTAPYALDLSVSAALNGRHRYTATAVDPSGNSASDTDSVLVAIGNRFLGSAPDNAADYLDFAKYFNQVTPGNASKWGSVEAARNEMAWNELDTAFEFATANGFPLKLHTLVWGQQEPPWVAALPPSAQLAELEEWMAALAERYGDVAMIDVVNEPLHAPPSYSEALGGAGETGWDWVIAAFELARTHFPRSELLLNDYQVEILETSTDDYLEIVDLLKERGLIDGIGVQGHFLERAELPVVEANLAKLAATGLPIYVTEFDVNLANDAQHANVFRDLFTMFWEHPSVLGVTHWGYRQGSVWQPNSYLLRSDGTPRPALDWLVCYLAGGDECSVPEYVPGPKTGTELGISIEAETYDEGQGLIALGNVVAYTDDGDWLHYASVIFQDSWDSFSVRYAKGNAESGSISVHLDSLASEPLFEIELPPTAGWGDFQSVEVPWVPLSGEHDVYVRFNGTTGVANVDRFAFLSPVPDDGLGPNLVGNGDFELGTSGWFGWGGTLATTTERAHDGAQSLRVSDRLAGQGTAAYDLTSAVTPGTAYQARFFVTIGGAASAPVNVTLKVVCAGQSDAYSWLANSSAVSDGVWTELAGTLVVPDCDLTELLAYVEGPPAGVDLYVDGVSVRKPIAANLVSNGDFELGTSGWFGWGGTLGVSAARAHGGLQSLLVSDRNAGAGTAAYDLTSAVSPGATYLTSFFVTIGGAATAPVNVTSKVTCTGESAVYSWVSSSSSVADGVWAELSGQLALPDCELSEVQIYAEGPPAGVDLYVDDVMVSP
jgi:endo-1,4-beta-xylanase